MSRNNATIQQEESIVDTNDILNGDVTNEKPESLVIEPPSSKGKHGTVLVSPKPAKSAPPVDHERIGSKKKKKKRNSVGSLSMMFRNDKKLIPKTSDDEHLRAHSLQLADENQDSPSGPIVIKLSNTDDVNLVEQYFSGLFELYDRIFIFCVYSK